MKNENQKRKKAEEIVRRHVLLTVENCSDHAPLIDMEPLCDLQSAMFDEICGLYNVKYTKADARAWFSRLSEQFLSDFIEQAGVRFIPERGFLVGNFPLSILAGASTYALGRMLIRQIEKKNVNLREVESLKKEFQQECRKGKHTISQSVQSA